MATITVRVPAEDGADYLQQVIEDIENGYRRGDYGPSERWSVEFDENEIGVLS